MRDKLSQIKQRKNEGSTLSMETQVARRINCYTGPREDPVLRRVLNPHRFDKGGGLHAPGTMNFSRRLCSLANFIMTLAKDSGQPAVVK